MSGKAQQMQDLKVKFSVSGVTLLRSHLSRVSRPSRSAKCTLHLLNQADPPEAHEQHPEARPTPPPLLSIVAQGSHRSAPIHGLVWVQECLEQADQYASKWQLGNCVFLHAVSDSLGKVAEWPSHCSNWYS